MLNATVTQALANLLHYADEVSVRVDLGGEALRIRADRTDLATGETRSATRLVSLQAVETARDPDAPLAYAFQKLALDAVREFG